LIKKAGRGFGSGLMYQRFLGSEQHWTFEQR